MQYLSLIIGAFAVVMLARTLNQYLKAQSDLYVNLSTWHADESILSSHTPKPRRSFRHPLGNQLP